MNLKSSLSRLLGFILITISCGFGYGLIRGIFDVNQQQLFTKTKVQDVIYTESVSRTEYERLRLGMSLGEVEAILGRGVETEQSATNTNFIWRNQDGSEITANFQNGKLTRKTQSKLK
ncbi:hypothetical protein I8748_27695 [Nostoc sp. CENA67]|uniref:Lipoprotein SmpA/OmlA domain-containing protein n=1 Tax=Amazonocrinis nigriterrae CENA67 TaxID=2794033 RepID=A0A8J7LBX8_9NOST|nr:hypothetical protein [Amazonocrinis nigriterrae]MBH8565906.1 hypothetical protein [Amazonocrinis nigriterrae CENA67]